MPSQPQSLQWVGRGLGLLYAFLGAHFGQYLRVPVYGFLHLAHKEVKCLGFIARLQAVQYRLLGVSAPHFLQIIKPS